MKICISCKISKSEHEFAKARAQKDGLYPYCKTCSKRKLKEWHNSHPEGQILYSKNYRNSIKEKIFDHYGWKCACCGETIKEFLTIDHVNGGGSKQKKILGSNHQVWLWIIKNDFPDNFQTLCMNCNFAKGKKDSGGICPHEKLK